MRTGIGGMLLGAALASAAIAGCAQPLTEATGTGSPDRRGRSRDAQLHSDRARLPFSAEGQISAAIGRAEGSYSVRALAASNRAQHLHLRFTRSGVVVHSGHSTLQLALDGLARTGELLSLPRSTPRVAGNRVTYARGSVSEWYVNGPLGLEQGFDVLRRPSGNGDLHLGVRLSGVRTVRPDATGAELTLAGGRALRYAGLTATDATGRSLPARLAFRSGEVSIVVDDRGARYPVRVDPFVQQGSKLQPSDESGNGEFGVAVALSSDGNTAAIGAPDDNTRPGAVFIFVRSNGAWSEQQKLVGSGAVGTVGEIGEGHSVALSADGNTVLFGAEGDNSSAGAAWVFVRSGTSWSQQGSKIVPADAVTGSGSGVQFGYSAALSSDGNTALIGGRGDSTAAGAAWVYVRSSGAWSEQTKLTAAGSSNLGASVALSSDGNTALVGRPGEPTGGAPSGANVFVRSGTTWSAQGSELVGTGVSGGSSAQGDSVALSSDGNTALVGGPSDNSFVGATWVFVRASGSWSQQGAKLVGAQSGVTSQQQGASVALTGDGNTALIGEISGIGGAWVFTRSGTTWSQQGGLLRGTGASGTPNQGTSAALSSDGTTAMLGGPNDTNGVGGLVGAAWAFGNAPTVSGVNPNSGPAAGGTPVTISGANLANASEVDFGTTAVTSFSSDTATQITLTSPAHAAGTVDVTVVTPAGTSPTSSSDQFTYTTGGSGGGSGGGGGASTQAPGVTTGIPSVLSSTGAAFAGSVVPNGLTTNASFQYGLDSEYSAPGTSGPSYTDTTPTQTVGSDFSAHPVSASVSGLVPNALYHFRLVATNGAGTTFGPDQTFTTPQDPPPPRPVLGQSFDVKPVSGRVFIKLPGAGSGDVLGTRLLAFASLTKGAGFVPLTEARQLPSGTQVDARQGTLQLTAAPSTKHGKLQNGTFSGGLFTSSQARSGLSKGLTTLSLLEGAFPGAPSYSSCKTKKAPDPPSATAIAASSVLQTLRSSAHGRFRTRGRYAAATVRGTAWTTIDRCDGTLVTVQRDTVSVQDLVRHVTVLVHAGHRYLARASGKRKH